MGTDLPLARTPSGAVVGRKSRWFIFIRSDLRELDEGGNLRAGRQSTRVVRGPSTRRNDVVGDTTDDVDGPGVTPQRSSRTIGRGQRVAPARRWPTTWNPASRNIAMVPPEAIGVGIRSAPGSIA